MAKCLRTRVCIIVAGQDRGLTSRPHGAALTEAGKRRGTDARQQQVQV